jgi:nitric oxide reductase NorE protein
VTNVASAGSLPHGDDMQPVANDTSKTVGYVPGQPDMWAFVLFEAFLFTGYFVVYMVCRTQNPELYLQSQVQLDLRIGTFNTLVLLASSWSVACCVQSAREGEFPSALTNAFLTMFLGVVFLVSKVFEWAREIEKGFGFSSDEFFSFYYFLTAIHFLHLLIGFVVLGVVVYQLWSPVRRSQELVETGATYWHTIDFLWVIIFALLYVMR